VEEKITVPEALQRAIRHHQAGQLADAERCYRAILQAQAQHPDANHNLGVLALGLGKPEAALPFFKTALQANPKAEQFWLSYTDCLVRLGDYKNAHTALEAAQIIGIPEPTLASIKSRLPAAAPNPLVPAAHSSPAQPDLPAQEVLVQLYAQQRFVEMEAAARAMIRDYPDFAFGWETLAPALKNQQRYTEAIEVYRQALRMAPNSVMTLANFADCLNEAGLHEEAVVHASQAIALDSTSLGAHVNLGNAHLRLEDTAAALQCYQRALALNPNSADAHSNIGAMLIRLERYVEAETSLRRALQLKPDHPEALSHAGKNFINLGHYDAAASCFEKIEFVNLKASAISGILLNLRYLNRYSSEYFLERAKQYGKLVSRNVTQAAHGHFPHTTPPRLRVGLVSGDFRNHPVGYFLEGFLPHLDRARIEIVAYPTYSQTDELTERLRPNFSAWVPLHGQSDAAAAKQIAADGIHVLLDLSGHTGHNRLPLFAFKPAPVQASWLGYFATTGVEQMDYVLADPYIAPPDEENHFTERVWRLPESYMCMSPPAIAVELAPLPALSAGHLTFGCFNNLTKMNDAVVALWARVLLAVPSARLLLKTKQLADEKIRQRTYERFAAQGIAADRLVLEGPSTRAELLAAYHRVDIALDPFPYPGGTTSAEALWMGVPVLTRQGVCFLSHVGETIAHNAGQANWIARHDADYVAKAVAFASDLATLAQLRAGLRAQVLASPLFDAERFAKNVEAALWGMWQQWLDTQQEGTQ